MILRIFLVVIIIILCWCFFYMKLRTKMSKNVEENTIYLNWIDFGAVTTIKNREFCRSDWAFSATGSLEAQWFFKTGQLITLSEQNLIDCSYDEGNNGCSGGSMEWAFEYISKNKGINSESDYPYAGEEYFICRYKHRSKGVGVNGWKTINLNGNEALLLDALINIGPISVGINLQNSFYKYQTGIYFEKNCTTYVDYFVLLVGYGTFNNTDYWIIKNSMGTNWGENGFMKLVRNKNNHCGIATYGVYPIV